MRQEVGNTTDAHEMTPDESEYSTLVELIELVEAQKRMVARTNPDNLLYLERRLENLHERVQIVKYLEKIADPTEKEIARMRFANGDYPEDFFETKDRIVLPPHETLQ